MRYDLDPAIKVLRTFLAEIENIKLLRKNISPPQAALALTIKDKIPIFDASTYDHSSDTYWEKEDAYIWLYADAWNYRSLMHRPVPMEFPEYYKQPAWPLYEQWKREKKEVLQRKCEKIPPPKHNSSLADYLQRLALIVYEKNEYRDVWIESLRCITQFLREDTSLDQKGLLEMLFPSQESCKGMEFRKDTRLKRYRKTMKKVECRTILRRIEDTVYPIDIFAASEIINYLFQAVFSMKRAFGFSQRPMQMRSHQVRSGFAHLLKY